MVNNTFDSQTKHSVLAFNSNNAMVSELEGSNRIRTPTHILWPNANALNPMFQH